MGYEYINEDEIDPELVCSICHSPFNDPCCTPCGETFCRVCVTNWLKRPNDTCPLCRKPLSLNVLTPATHMVRNILDRLQVKCLACGLTQLTRGEFHEHVQKTCLKKTVSPVSTTTKPPLTERSKQHNQRVREGNPISNIADINQRIVEEEHRTNRPNTSVEGTTSSNSVLTLILSLIFFGIIFYLFDNHSTTTSINKTTNVLENNIKVIPMSCSSTGQCPYRHIKFEDSNLLTDEHQNHLNSFYNDMKSDPISKWKLIYRGSRDGSNSAKFHEHCDNKDETFIILSSTNGFLFGGYTDTNWTTPQPGYPTYGRSTKAFLFSLMNPQKVPSTKLSLDAKYENYATVNDFLSGPVFGTMMRPDIGIYESNGEFRCQINFPSLYKGSVGVPYFPTSNDCVINEMEVFIPVFKSSSSFLFRMFTMILSVFISCVEVILFVFIPDGYNNNDLFLGRFFSCASLIFLWINYWYGYLFFIEMLFVLFLLLEWNTSISHRHSVWIQFEKRFVMSSFVFIVICMILFF